MSEPSKGNSSTESKPLKDWQLFAPFALIVLLQVVGTFVNDNNVWGINLWSVLPVWGIIVAACVYVALSVPSISLLCYSLADELVGLIRRGLDSLPRWVNWVIVTAVLAAIAWLCRSRALIYGDGFVVVSISERPFANAFVTLHDYYRPLTILIQQGAQFLSYFGFDSRETIFWIMRIAEGVFGWLGLIRLVRVLSDDSLSRAIIFLTALTAGSIVLLLGWVELYVLPTALLLWLLASAVAYVCGRGGFWPVCLFGVLAMLASAIVVPVTLMVILLSLKLRNVSRIAALIPRPGLLFGLVTLFAIVAGVLFNLLTEVNFVVPLLATSINPYWSLSPRHLIDLVNLVFFLAPSVVVVAILLALNRGIHRLFSEPTDLLLGLAGWTCLLVSFWLNPVLGAPCDWDLLSFFGLPLTVLAGFALTKIVTNVRQRKLLVVQLAMVAAILIIPNIYEKTHLDIAVKRIEPLAWNDIHYQPTYYQAHRCISFGSLLLEKCDQPRLAEKFFRRRIQAKPDDELGWYNLGVLFFKRQQFGQAASCFERAVELNPGSVEFHKSLEAASLKAMQSR